MKLEFDNDPDLRTVRAHVLFDVMLLGVLLLCMAAWDLSFQIAGGILAISIASTLGAYQTYRRRRRERRDLPEA
ncbi:MAG: hypothetical protein QOE76_3441 [Frankiales bacterium]|jgi:hypothetical protein|nr:hypothetical protein [Frankiales bacterium]